jgi:predicted nucleic acid-binding protein
VKPAISDTDILSSFGKVGRTDLLQRLFLKIYAAPAVYRELTRAEQLGLAWVTAAKEAVELLPLTEKQSKEVEQLATACPQLGSGEIETFVLAKAHHSICLTNDRQAKKVCQSLRLAYLDLEEILRALKLKGIMTPQALAQLIEQIEERDHTRIKAKKHILRD